MKTYSWEQVIKALKDDDRLEFITRDGRLSINKGINGMINFIDSGYRSVGLYGLNAKEEFILVSKPVSFIEAVNSGKRIKFEMWSDFHTLSEVMTMIGKLNESVATEILNGKWHVKEDF